MPRAAHIGRPGSTILPPGWQAAHADVLTSTRTADVVVIRSAGATFGPGLDLTPETITVLFGRARIQPRDLQGRAGGSVASEDTHARDYLVQLDWVTDLVEDGDEVIVLGSSDQLMVGRSFRVSTVLTASLRFTRDLICELDTQNGARP